MTMTTTPNPTAEPTLGWHEFILDGAATTHIAYVYEDGSIYLPEGPEVVVEADFRLASAVGCVFPLVRTHGRLSEGAPTEEQVEQCEWCEAPARGSAFWQGDDPIAHHSCGEHGFDFRAAAGVAPQETSDWDFGSSCPWCDPDNRGAGYTEDAHAARHDNDDREKLIAEAERLVTASLTRLSKRDDWAEDDTAIGGQSAHIVALLDDRAILAAQPVKLDPSYQEMIDNWLVVADHEAFNPCRNAEEELPFVDHMLNRLTDLVSLEQTVNELAPAPRSLLDPEKVAEVLWEHRITILGQCVCGYALSTYGRRSHDPEEIDKHFAHAICEAAKRGELT